MVFITETEPPTKSGGGDSGGREQRESHVNSHKGSVVLKRQDDLSLGEARGHQKGTVSRRLRILEAQGRDMQLK